MKDTTRRDLARRYGYFLDHVDRTEGLHLKAETAAYVTPDRVDYFRGELQARVCSVTVHGSIYKLRRTAQLLAPGQDFTWLIEIEKDLALVMQPKSKFNRTVHTQVLVDAAITLMTKADAATHRSALARAREYRNGLMVAMLAFHPIRLKNFAALEIGRTFRQVNDSWWIVLPASETKEERPDERVVDPSLTGWIDRYLCVHRPILARNNNAPKELWLSSNEARAMTYLGIEGVISETTLAIVGVDVCPHLFRTAGVSTAAVYAGDTPNLGSALLHHTDPTIAGKHYNRAKSLSATQNFSRLVRTLRDCDGEPLSPPL